MIFGYVLFAYSNDKSMFKDLILNKCDKYSDIYTINRVSPSFKLKTQKPISTTHDHFTIVSEDFKNFCLNENYTGLEFVNLPSAPGFYWFKIHNTILLNPEDKGIRFINFNSDCNGYEEIIGATPAYLKIEEKISDGFFRSDICFGSYETKTPLKIIGIETMEKLKKKGFKGIYGSEIKPIYE